MIRLAVLVTLLGCGRLGFGEAGAPGDAALDALPADAPPPTGPFGVPVAVASINTASSEDDPSLTADQLEIFFDSSRAGGMGGGDLWTASRDTIGDPWDPATNIAALNTTGDDATPEISRDGLSLYWVSAGPAGAKDVYVATRATRTAPWGPRVHVPELSSAADESGPAPTPDGLVMYLSRDTSGTDDIFVATRASTGDPWGTPVAITELNAAGVFDGEPFINGANTFVVWASDRGGNRDLWMARRASPSEPWGAPQPIDELNTPNVEGDPWLSPDEHVLYFTRGTDIFVATR